jgi:ATP-dependent protease ClpP protease subunit
MRWMAKDGGDVEGAEAGGASSNSKPAPDLTVKTVNNHVYFYARVDDECCLALLQAVRELDVSLRSEHIGRELPHGHPLVPIWLHIQSPGGGLFAGLGVADQLAQIETPIYSVVEGYCASAATLISMACSKRFIRPSAFMLIHQLSNVKWGTYEQFKDEMHLLDMAMEVLTKFYTEHSKLKKGRIRKLLQRDSWFSAQESMANGFVDEILK